MKKMFNIENKTVPFVCIRNEVEQLYRAMPNIHIFGSDSLYYIMYFFLGLLIILIFSQLI